MESGRDGGVEWHGIMTAKPKMAKICTEIIVKILFRRVSLVIKSILIFSVFMQRYSYSYNLALNKSRLFSKNFKVPLSSIVVVHYYDFLAPFKFVH